MKKQIQINDLIFQKIKFRYDFYDSVRVWDKMTANKLFIDTFYPFDIASSIRDNQKTRTYITSGRNGYAISERVAEDTGARRLHISELITMLGYTKTDITKMLQHVKNLELDCVLVGLGGTGSNFLHWLYEMSEWTGKSQIFHKIRAFDDDEFDVPNMLRIPFIPQYRTIENEAPFKTKCIPLKFNNASVIFVPVNRKLTEEDLSSHRIGMIRKTFIYGAPDIATRTFLSRGEYTFFAATHRDGEYSIVENPDVDNDLMLETYGKINLSKFFLNHLSMTIDFLRYLPTRTEPYDTQRQNVEIVREDFDTKFRVKLDTGFKAGSKKLFVVSEPRIRNELELEGDR